MKERNISKWRLRLASPKMTTQSLDRKLLMRSPNDTDRSPVLCNQYALDDLEDELRRWHSSTEDKTDCELWK